MPARRTALQDLKNFLIALERRNEIRAGEFGAGPVEYFAGNFESAVARGGPRGFHGLQKGLGNDDAGDFIVQAKRLLVAVERPDADQHRNRRLAAKFFQESVPVFGVEERLS